MPSEYLKYAMAKHPWLNTAIIAALTGRTQRVVQMWLSGRVPVPGYARLIVQAIDERALDLQWLSEYLNEKETQSV